MSTDLNDAIETGVVRDTGIDSFDNGIDDVSVIFGRIEDAFDAIDKQRLFAKSLKSARDKAASLASSRSSTTYVSTPTGGEAN